MPSWCDCEQKMVEPSMCGGCEDAYDDCEEWCDHTDCDIDVLTGRAMCNMCSASWWATSEQIRAQEQHQREYAEWQEREYRRERWLWWTAPFRRLWCWTLTPFAPKLAIRALDDDEIPF